MWFLHHDNLSSNHGASLGDPTFPGPQILFLTSAHRDVAKLEVQLWCICRGFSSAWFLYYWDFPWSRFFSIKQNQFLFSEPPCLSLRHNGDQEQIFTPFPYFVPTVLVHFIFILFQTTTSSVGSRRCGYPVLLRTFIGLEPRVFPVLHCTQLPPGDLSLDSVMAGDGSTSLPGNPQRLPDWALRAFLWSRFYYSWFLLA